MAQIVENGQIVEEETQEIQETTEEQEELAASEETDETTEETEESEESEESEEPEPWMAEDEEDNDVPLSAHIRLKKKLKGRLSEKDERIEQLEAKVQELEGGRSEQVLKRPKSKDYDTDEEYDEALSKYEDQRDILREQARTAKETRRRHQEKVTASVEDHYERATKLISDNGVDATRYKKADENLRTAVETILPKQGDIVVDQIIHLIGDGSEKTLFYVGNNKNALNEFKSHLMEDKSGLSAAFYLGKQHGRLTNPTKRISRAPKPTPKLKGDGNTSSNVKALKKAYDKAHKEGKIQQAYNAKKQAKAAGADVSSW